jgi:hypothetical protein
MYTKPQQAQQELAAFIKAHPELSWMDIALSQSVSLSQVSKVARMFDLQRKIRRGPRNSHIELTVESL